MNSLVWPGTLAQFEEDNMYTGMRLKGPNCIGLKRKRVGKDEDTLCEAGMIFSMFALKEGERKPTPKNAEKEEEPRNRQNIKNKSKYAGTYSC